MTGPESFWTAITWLGDSGVMLPIAVWIAVWLAVCTQTRRIAWLWCGLFGVAGLLVATSKIAFMGWGIGSATLNFTGFSGHSANAASIWPVAFWLIASRWEPRVRIGAAAAGWMLAGLIGLSRLALYAHSKSEVALGLALGGAVSATFLWLHHRQPQARLNGALVLASLFTPLLFMQPGTKAPTQALLERIAVRLAGVERPFTRDDLRRPRA